MNDLNKYYNILFKKAKHRERYAYWIEMLIIAFSITSIFVSGNLIFIITALMFIAQIGVFWLNKIRSRDESLAHRLHEYAILYSNFRNSTFNFDISQIKGSISSSVHELVEKQKTDPDSSDYLVDDTAKNALLLMIQENAFWNYHLYNASFWRAIFKIVVPIIGMAFIALLIFILNPGLVDKEYTAPRILIAILAANVVFSQVDNIFKWYSGAKEMLELDNIIARDTEKSDDFWLHIFAKYNIAKTSTPLVADSIYRKNKDKLNKAWESRFFKLYREEDTPGKVSGSHMKCLRYILKNLSGVSYPWAVIGGANHVLQGIPVKLRDIDIITTKEGFDDLSVRFEDFVVEEPAYRETDNLRSWFAVFIFNGVRFEVMANVENKVGKDWQSHGNWHEHIVPIQLNSFEVPCLTLDFEEKIYQMLGNDQRVGMIKVKKNNL